LIKLDFFTNDKVYEKKTSFYETPLFKYFAARGLPLECDLGTLTCTLLLISRSESYHYWTSYI